MKFYYTFWRTVSSAIVMLMICSVNGYSVVKTTVSSGNWNTASVWSPGGVPASSDNVTIASGHSVTISSNQSVKDITVNAGGVLSWTNSSMLTVTGKTIVNGIVDMNGGNMNLPFSGLKFILGPNSIFTWNPGDNTVAGATLFTNGMETFDPTSTLIIKKWYSYAVPLGSLVSGNFGNLELNSLSGTAINEWNQANQFESHIIVGTLTVDQGWITLDKSGRILNTTIGNIVLKNINSSLYGHNGTHPGSFTITTSSVENAGGNFFGINDGNGNILVHVAGDFTNIGNVKIINNSGISGVSNGDATFIVDSAYSQSAGDTRVIYNVSTTNSGLYNATFGNLTLTGGIFMGQTGCRTSGGICSLTVLQNFKIDFSSVTDKFRGTSITSISSSLNNVRLNMTIGGDLSIAGHSSAEMTSTASAGIERVLVKGNAFISGCTSSFNYGSANAAHNHSLSINGNTIISGGTTYLSRNSGVATIFLNGNLSSSSGMTVVKGADGITTLNVAGNFLQSGGLFYLHNSNVVSSESVSMISNGDFTQSGGTFNFDNNTANTSAVHFLTLNGANLTLTGTGSVTRSGAGSCSVFGMINYNRAGTISYNRTSNMQMLNQVKQIVKSGCTLTIANGNLLVASYPSIMTDLVKVESGGVLNVQTSQLFSNGAYANSGLWVDSAGTIVTQRAQGFYNGTPSGCINSNYNMNYFLDQNSIVEYNGSTDQELTGTGLGLATGIQHQYGILKINLLNASNKVLMNQAITVRWGLQLTNGAIDLNGNNLAMNNGVLSAISRINGYINCELNSQNVAGKITWNGLTAGTYEFPFGTKDLSYIPVSFSLTGGSGAVDISTYSTPLANNLPVPSVGSTPVNFSTFYSTFSQYNVIDRWWKINATGMKANVQLSYRGIENTLPPSIQTCTLNIMQWNGSGWNTGSNTSMGVQSGVGTVSIQGARNFSVLAISHQSQNGGICRLQPPVFEAVIVQNEVSLQWTTFTEVNSEYFSLERSSDGVLFEEIKRVKAAGTSNSTLKYSEVDEHPLTGTTYYRLKLIGYDGQFSYSELRMVTYDGYKAETLSIESFGPNPFTDNFWVGYKTGRDGVVHFQLYSSNGQLVNSSESSEMSGEHRFEYNDGTDLQPGIYFLKILIGEKVVTQKLIKR